MAESSASSTKRRREKYSRLICLGCRARRIRCALPDTTIEPSPDPQPPEKACQRCQQNGLDCIVDYTTLGRPAQKRNRLGEANSNQQQNTTNSKSNENFEDSVSHDVDDFLLSYPEDQGDGITVITPPKKRPSKKEVADSMTSAFHLLSALLARDKQFASSIGSQPLINQSVLELIDESNTTLLDSHLVWHKLYHPDIPSLSALRKEVKSTEIRQPERVSSLYLLTLLCDIALDIPSPRLASLRYLQPAVKAMTYHHGQQLLFTLSHNKYTVLALLLTAEYRPLALTSSQTASGHALKAVPYVIMAKYVASELGYQKAGSRLTQALNSFDVEDSEITTLLHQCVHWIWLNIAEDLQGGPFNEWVRRMDPSALECLEALQSAMLFNRMPSNMLFTYCSTSYWTQMLANVRDMSEHWKDLDHLGEVIQGHKVFCDRERETLDRLLDQYQDLGDLSPIVSHLAEMERHLSHTVVEGLALFFAVMCGAFAQSHHGKIHSEQAIQVSDNIINQLLAHDEHDSARPAHRRFLEQYGSTRTDELERVLTNFITAADTFTLNGVAYVGETRNIVGWVIIVCKDIVEGNAARLKGWGGLHDRVDVHMILFHECARRLESMSASAGSADALSKGCILTAGAKLVRSLHRVLQGFKKTLAASQRRSAASTGSSGSSKSDPTPPSVPTDMPTLGDTMTTASSEWESILADDQFTDWANWPQFDALDFSDLFGDMFDFDGTGF